MPVTRQTKGRGTSNKPTKIKYEEYLNSLSPEQGSDEWIIGGKIRLLEMWQNRYGKALRSHDPIAFQTGYNEWVLEQKQL